MTTIYLISNNLVMKKVNFETDENTEVRREKRILSIKGEEESRDLLKIEELLKVNKIYTSDFVSSMETARYLAEALELELNVNKSLGERVIGNLGDKKIRMVNEMQENDFDYKLSGGESLNDVKRRMLRFLKVVLINNPDKNIALFTHNIALTSLLTEFCDKGFNLDNRLILNFQEEVIIDGPFDGIKVIKLVFKDKDISLVSRIK